MLPILTFDEGRLSPSYGYFFDRRWLAPQETIVSIAWKFARMNALPGHIVARQFSQHQVDPYDGIAATAVEIAVPVLASAFAIPRRALRDGIEPARRLAAHARAAALLHEVHEARISRRDAPARWRRSLPLSWRRPGRAVPRLRHVRRIPAQRPRLECALPMLALPPTLFGFGPQLLATTAAGRSAAGDHALALQGLRYDAREPIRQPRHR